MTKHDEPLRSNAADQASRLTMADYTVQGMLPTARGGRRLAPRDLMHGTKPILNPGMHRLSEVMYAYASAAVYCGASARGQAVGEAAVQALNR
jgi:hypothetical protein